MSIPHLFRCPISLDLFTDPVTLSTGQTYDRSSIEKWLASGNSTCPVTMQRLQDKSLVPNCTLRQLIHQWLLSAHSPTSRPGPKPTGTGTGTAFSLTSLKQSLQAADTGMSSKLEILKKVRILCNDSDVGRACLVQLGYFPLLLHIILPFVNKSLVDSELVEVGLDCVLSLSDSTQLGYLNILKNESSLASFLLLLDKGNVKIKASLCCLLEKISTSDSTQQLCLLFGQSKQALQLVISLLTKSDTAIKAISGLCSVEANRMSAIREGAVDGLVSYLMSSNMKQGSLALATLEVLVGTEEGKYALIKNLSAVQVLVKSVFRVSSSSNREEGEGGEHAVGVLLVICSDSAKARMEAVNAGVFRQVLLLLQSQCGSKAKAKGRALLKLLRSMWIRDPGLGVNFYYVM